MARLLRAGLGVGLLASRFVEQLTGLVTVPVTHAPARVEHIAWSRRDLTPATSAFLNQLGLTVE